MLQVILELKLIPIFFFFLTKSHPATDLFGYSVRALQSAYIYLIDTLTQQNRGNRSGKVTWQIQSRPEILLRWPNTVCARFTDSVSDAIKRALGLW